MNPLIKTLPIPASALNGKRINVKVITTEDRIEGVGIIDVSEQPGGYILNINFEGNPARQISLSEELAGHIQHGPLGAHYEYEFLHPDVLSL